MVSINKISYSPSTSNIVIGNPTYLRGVKGGSDHESRKIIFPNHDSRETSPIHDSRKIKTMHHDKKWIFGDFITNCKKCSQSRKTKTPNHEERCFIFLDHESRGDFQSRFTGNNLAISRFTEIKNGRSRHHEKDLSPPLFVE